MRSEIVQFKTAGGTVYHSVNDWGMRLTHCDEQKPAPKFTRVDVPGANGSIDLSTALTGDIPFEDRVVELTFFKLCTDHSAALTQANTIVDKIHGKQLYIQTPDAQVDGAWYWGNVEVENLTFEDRGCEVSVRCVCDPFKYKDAGGTLSMSPSTKSTVATNTYLASLTSGDLDSNGIEFHFKKPTGGWQNHSALAVTFSRTANLFDMNMVNVRYKGCLSGGSWTNSSHIAQDDQTLVYTNVDKTKYFRAVLTATSATSGINKPRFAFVGNSHLYVLVESSTVTDSGSVTVGGTTYTPQCRVYKEALIGDAIASNGIATEYGETSTVLNAPTVGQSFSNVIDCGTVSAGLGQIAIDLIGVTCDEFTAQVMLVEDGGSAPNVFVEPSIEQIKIELPVEFKSNGPNEYFSMMPRAWVVDGGDSIAAQQVVNWPRDAVYVDFAGVDSSGWLKFYPKYTVEIDDWPEHTTTIGNGNMPSYPTATTDSNGAVIEYGGNVNVVPPSSVDAQLPTLLAAGTNTISYTLPGDAGASATLKWPKGVL